MKGNSYLRFRKLAPFYDAGVKLLGLPLGGEAAVREKVLNLLPIREGDRILEIGCGTGTVSLMAAERVGPSGEVIGIDPSIEMLSRAKKKINDSNRGRVSFIHGPGSPLSFSDSHFDAVIFFLALHEMEHEDRIDSLREAVRVVKDGGFVLVGELATPDPAWKKALLRMVLLIEEEEATDFLRRGLSAVIRETTGTALAEEKRTSIALGLGQGVLYRKAETPP